MKYFKVYELVDEATYSLLGDNAIKLFNQDLLKDLDQIREDLGRPITVNTWKNEGDLSQRGFRSQESNVGSKSSQHRTGNAVDFDVEGMNAIDVRTYILENKDLYPNIMRMEAKVGWVHLDSKLLRDDQERIYLFSP